MPRTIESIVDAHNAATERRRAGRPIWDHKLRIKHLLADIGSPTDEDAKRIGKLIAAAIERSAWGRDADEELHDLIEEFKDVIDVDHFNMIMDALYDLADYDRVWIG